MKIGVVGLGYVGTVTAIGFSRLGFDVVGVDVDQARVAKLRDGVPPFYEHSLEEYLRGYGTQF